MRPIRALCIGICTTSALLMSAPALAQPGEPTNEGASPESRDESPAGADLEAEVEQELDPAREIEDPEPASGAKEHGVDSPVPSEMTPEELVADEVVAENGDEAIVEVSRTTPVVPEEEGEPPKRAYQLYWELDLPILGAGAALAAARLFRTGEGAPHASCLTQIDDNGHLVRRTSCDPDEINAFDRLVAGRYDRSWAMVSDIGALSLAIAPPVLLSLHDGLKVGLNDTVVIYESALWAVAFSGIATLGGGRARPFVYGDEAPEDVRTSGNGSLSFVSSHTSVAFALATSTFWTVERRHGGDALTWTVFGLGMSTASLVGVSRVLAGSHFPTDVIAGAVVGMSVGTIVPMLHGTPVRVAASAGPERAEANVSYVF